MLKDYNKKDLETIKKCFETNYEESIKILLCNMKIEDTMSKFNSIIQSLKEDELEEINLFSDVKNITNAELNSFIEDNSFIRLQSNKCFVEIYEDFERTLKDMVEYIHYQKPKLTFNKNNKDVDGSTILDILEKEDALKDVIKMNINKNVNKIIYNRNIIDILSFISRYSKVKFSEEENKQILLSSKVRNIIVHNKGNITSDDLKSIFEISGEESEKQYKRVTIKSRSIKNHLKLFSKIIDETCTGLKDNL